MTYQPPLLTPSADFHTEPVRFLSRWHSVFGGVIALDLDEAPTVIFGGEGGIKLMASAERQHLAVVNSINVMALFRGALFNLSGDEHRRARRGVLAAVNGAWLPEIAPRLSALINRHVQHWADVGTVDLVAACRRLTLTICAEIIMGLPRSGAERQAFPDLFDAFAAAGGPNTDEQTFQAGFAASTELRSMIFRQVYRDRRGGVDVVSRLVEDDRVPAESIADHVLAIMIATRETTASLGAWMLIELARDADLAARAAAGASAPEVMRRVLWETERLHSPNTLSRRRVVKDLDTPYGTIPEGWHAAYSPAANHLFPDFFPDPDRFLPSRFNGIEPPHTSRLYTFGHGPHACPGKSFAEMIATQVATQTVTTCRLHLS